MIVKNKGIDENDLFMNASFMQLKYKTLKIAHNN